jgi:hypothetical protein
MTTSHARHSDRVFELLADRATQGLSPIEAAELHALFEGDPAKDDSLDLAAAALDLAFLTGNIEPAPASVLKSLSAMGNTWSQGQAASAPRATRPFASRPQADRWKFAAWSGWLAAAAAIVLAFAGWWSQGAARSAPADALRLLMARATDLQSIPWTPGPSEAPQGVTGEVVWSNSCQEGYMVFRNMKPNDPAAEQFQLWIFDAARDERYPVDGGVFDITAGGECIVPIRPGVRIDNATLFAVTIERPGGVVVSDRSRLPLLAQPGKSG